MKYTLDTNIVIDGFHSEDAQAEEFAFLNHASCREQGITLITKDGDFKRLAPFVKGFQYAAPWPMAADTNR